MACGERVQATGRRALHLAVAAGLAAFGVGAFAGARLIQGLRRS